MDLSKKSWIVTRVDGRIASVAADWRHFAEIAAKIASFPADRTGEVTASRIATEDLPALSASVRWGDLCLMGTDFQRRVWRELYLLAHRSEDDPALPDGGVHLLSYSQLAQRCENLPGVRAVAHAVAVNPVAYIIPCHLIVPKESIDKVQAIRTDAQKTIFQGEDLYLLDSIDVGGFAYGKKWKRALIGLQLEGCKNS